MTRRHVTVVLLSLVAAGASVAAAVAAGGAPTRAIWRRYDPALRSPCDLTPAGSLSYNWPVKPFMSQHPIRGNFGDPRTIARGRLGSSGPHESGSFTFHNGVDISAPAGTPVYPVVSGTVDVESGDEVTVHTSDGRAFQYFHIRPSVRTGQPATAYKTVLGPILPEWNHVHLSEIDLFRVHNPVDPGHLTPYRDRTIPVVAKLEFRTSKGRELDASALQGTIDVVAKTADTPAVAVPGAWFDFPVTPALVSWELTRDGHGIAVPWTTIADFRRTLPPNQDFWRVYAPGTFQNFPVFGNHYFFGLPGRYLFNLTPAGLDTRPLANGRYVVAVRVADVCANSSLLREVVVVSNPQQEGRSRGIRQPLPSTVPRL